MAATLEIPALTWLRRVLLLAFAALAAWLLVRAVLTLLEPTRAWEPVELAAPAQAAPGGGARVYDFSTNPFAAGDAQPDGPATGPVPEDAPETTLNLMLFGQRAGPSGSAYIRTPSGEEDNFIVGDTVMNGVTLVAVFPDHVLLDVNGETQRLTSEDAKVQSGRDAPAWPAPQGATSTRTLNTLQVAGAQTLMQSVNVEPAFDRDGQRIGVTLEPHGPGVDLSDYGLRRSDVITAFAGQSLVMGLPDVASLRRATQNGRAVSVDIIRAGQPMTLTIGGPA